MNKRFVKIVADITGDSCIVDFSYCGNDKGTKIARVVSNSHENCNNVRNIKEDKHLTDIIKKKNLQIVNAEMLYKSLGERLITRDYLIILILLIAIITYTRKIVSIGN